MTEGTATKLPGWFWAVAILALLWELSGVGAYMSHVSMTDADIQALPEGQRQMFQSMPAWVTGAYAFAVFGGLLGAVGLLLRRGWSRLMFIVSLAAVLLQFGWAFGVAKAHEVVGPSAFGLPALIVILAIVLVWFSSLAIKRGWLR